MEATAVTAATLSWLRTARKIHSSIAGTENRSRQSEGAMAAEKISAVPPVTIC